MTQSCVIAFVVDTMLLGAMEISQINSFYEVFGKLSLFHLKFFNFNWLSLKWKKFCPDFVMSTLELDCKHFEERDCLMLIPSVSSTSDACDKNLSLCFVWEMPLLLPFALVSVGDD